MRRFLIAVPVLCACLVTLGAQQADKKWDVTQPFGPSSTVTFDTTEGTWMNVDVSPTGREIVFDLLGDLYTMPIGGSGTQPAKRLLGGLAFEMQPRFSPDGSRIAFTSDRDGLWNIWTMKAAGTDLCDAFGRAQACAARQRHGAIIATRAGPAGKDWYTPPPCRA